MVKSPTPRSRRSDCPFTKEEQIWIVTNLAQKTPSQIRQLFICDRNIVNKHKVPGRHAFKRLVDRFQTTGGVTSSNKGLPPFAVTPENVQKVETFFEENPTASISTAVRELGLSFGSIWFILRRHLKWRPYKIQEGQQAHAAKRRGPLHLLLLDPREGSWFRTEDHLQRRKDVRSESGAQHAKQQDLGAI